MTLAELLSASRLPPSKCGDATVLAVTHDSRQVRPGSLFVAVPGVRVGARVPLDGRAFIAQAVAAGAVAVVGEGFAELVVPYVQVSHAREVLADLASAFFGFPGRKLRLAGVTGSKGKSTTSSLLWHILQANGERTGLLSTVGARSGLTTFELPGHFTTPEAPEVQRLLAQFVDDGCKSAVLEVSSHALALERVRGLAFEVGVWTNLEPEHLDFHGTLEAYGREKRKLLERSAFTVTNAESPHQPVLGGKPGWSFGVGGDWRASEVRATADGLTFEVASPVGSGSARVPLFGAFNVGNVLAALAAAARLGVSLDSALAVLPSFSGVPGRMQVITTNPFRVIVDFAHTEASLRAALSALRPVAAGRILLVVGAAGERDATRRTALARVAAEAADLTVFTEEDHRGEDLDDILNLMESTCLAAGGHCEREPDRREAIRRALALARPGDTVLLAGKGHERTLERGSLSIPWNEAGVARELLNQNS